MAKKKKTLEAPEEKPSEETPVIKRRFKIGNAIRTSLSFFNFAVFVFIIGSAAYFYTKPQRLSEQFNTLFSKYVPTSQLKTEERLTNAIKQVETKVARVAEQNAYFLNIKADSSVILSMGERIDKLEKKTDRFALVSNDGALILSAAMMIKEVVSKGNSFGYEAEVLRFLSEGRSEIAPEVNYLYNNSSRQFPSDASIVENFNKAYLGVIEKSKPAPETDWKKRLISKFHEYVTISKESAVEPVAGYDKLKALKTIRELVNNYDFAAATNELSREENTPLMEDKEISDWYNLVKHKLKTYQSISKIASYSLALMKTEGLKNN